MHDYMVEAGKRRKVVQTIVCLYIVLCFISPVIGTFLMEKLAEMGMKIQKESVGWFYIKTVLSVLFSGLGVGILYKLYNYRVWKWFQKIHGIPDLTGSWQAEVSSGLKGDRKPSIRFTIKQTWTKLQVYGESQNGTITVSESASILQQHGQLYLSYAYWIMHQDGQCYPGYNSLLISKKGNKLSGLYFSAKNVRPELTQEYLQAMEESDREELLERLGGCGSKGKIVLEREV